MSAASLIATHLNAPYGKIVSTCDVITSLKSGCLSASSKEANSLLEALFIEVSPDLILKCADEINASLQKVNCLYQKTLELGLMPSQAWEGAFFSEK